jgi:hypothetical protein
MGELSTSLSDLQTTFCPPSGACLPKFPGYSRVFVRIGQKMTTIGTIFGDFSDELGTDLEAALGTADAADTTGETCLDPTDGSTPLDRMIPPILRR